MTRSHSEEGSDNEWVSEWVNEWMNEKKDFPWTERQNLRDDHLSTFLGFFSLAVGIVPSDRGPPF